MNPVVIEITTNPSGEVETIQGHKKEEVTEIIVKDGVTEIGEEAFLLFENCTKVTIADSVTKLGKGCFQGCYKLKNVKMSKNVTELPDQCFCDDQELEEVDSLENITTMGEQCFNWCCKMTFDALPKNLKQIDCSTFAFTGVKDITLPNQVLYIPQFAFLQCDSLEVLRCTNVRLVLEGACYMSKKLREVHFTDKLEVVEGQAFFMCESLKKVFIHKQEDQAANNDKILAVLDIDSVKDKDEDRYLSYKLISGNPLLFAADSNHSSKVSLFSPETDMNVDEVEEKDEDNPYSDYSRLLKDFDLSFTEFIDMAKIKTADGKMLKDKIGDPSQLNLQQRKDFMKEFNSAILNKVEAAVQETLKQQEVNVDGLNAELNDDQ